jgi:hypothetical protein
MNERRGSYYITYEVGWATKTCSHCKQRVASGHGWLFKEPTPKSPALDKRKPIGEVFIHDDGEDCVLLVESERPKSNQ